MCTMTPKLTKKSTINSFKNTRPIEAPAAGKIAMTPAGLDLCVKFLICSPYVETYPEEEKI